MCSAPVDSVEQPFTLTETRIEALENSCEIEILELQIWIWEVNATCHGEGNAYENKYKFALTTDGDLSVVDVEIQWLS